MGSLTRHLQDAFVRHCPRGWACHPEAALTTASSAHRLGYNARVDVLLEHEQSRRRVWVEFEVSRADPVANHAKFATARFLEGRGADNEIFVSMASRHIAPGRLALSAGTAMLMRGFGIAAFQMDLLPELARAQIKQLNAKPLTADEAHLVDARTELERVLQVGDCEIIEGGHRIYKADNTFAVAVNIRQWNLELQRAELAALWGRRRVRYFAYDPATGLFAPSKFCAFVPAARANREIVLPDILDGRPAGMTMSLYAILGEDDPRFDGRIAWKHLHRVLKYDARDLETVNEPLRTQFDAWLRQVDSFVQASGAIVLLTPAVLRERERFGR